MKIEFNEEQRNSFIRLKERIARSATRYQPNFTKEFILTTDASNAGIGAILTQTNSEGQEVMIAAFSKSLDKCQLNYSVTDKELLGVVKGIENFRHYLLGRKFKLRTDHKALIYMKSTKNTNGRLLRWSIILSEYTFDVEYIKGERNIADGLSRSHQNQKSSKIIGRIEEIDIEAKNKILEEYHLGSGHGSSNTMKFLLNQKYKWRGINKDIAKYVQECDICIRSPGPLKVTKNRVIHTERPNQLWEVDLIGKINESTGSKYIFIAIDHYTKWIETSVIKNKTGLEIAREIERLIIRKHGIPERILSDSGLEFDNKEIQALKSKCGIEWNFGSPYHHQTTGAVERANKTLKNILRKLTRFGDIQWSPLLEKATRAMNMSFNRAIGTSPYILKHSKLPELDIDRKLGVINKQFPMDRLITKRNQNFEKYKKSIIKGKLEKTSQIKVGDRVLIYRDYPGMNKNPYEMDWGFHDVE